MHCSDEEQEHSKVFYRSPKLEDVKDKTNFVPLCSECGANMKPHCMFFDEAYSEHYYRKETVEKFMETADCLIVAGTALATNFAKRIVATFLEKELPVIEINIESAINVGNNIQVLERSEKVFPTLFSTYYQLRKTAGGVNGLRSKLASKSLKSTSQVARRIDATKTSALQGSKA